MKDEEFNQKLAEVEDIIDRLNQGDVSLEKGEELRQRAVDLLDEVEVLLDQGDGKAVVVELDGGELVKEDFQF